MKRRHVLGSLGTLASLGTVTISSRERPATLEVRYWLSRRAATHQRVADRVRDYLEWVLSLDHWRLDCTYGGVVDVATENGAAVTRSGEWPRLVAAGIAGRNDLSVASDVNLLVTDGAIRSAPTGYGMGHVASVGGANELARVEPVRESRPIHEYTTPNWVMQVLVHEVGHALGLHHDHGVSYDRGGTTVVTPMISTYAFDETYPVDASRCGDRFPTTADSRDRALQLPYSACARDRLERYQGGIIP